MIKKLFLALTIVMISASPAWAEEWVSYSKDVNGNEYFVDTDSIRIAKGFVYYWQITNNLEPAPYRGTLSIKEYTKLFSS